MPRSESPRGRWGLGGRGHHDDPGAGHRGHDHVRLHGAAHEHGPGLKARRGRVARGDVRQAVLLLLSEEPMHGYQLMQAIAERSGGRWAPSPGAIYPTINQLEDEGLVSVTAEAGRRLATLTEAGHQAVADLRQGRPDPFADYAGSSAAADLRRILHQLHAAARSVALGGSEEQLGAAAGVLNQARRSLYLILAEGADGKEGVG